MSKVSWRLLPVLVFLSLSLFLWKGLSLDPHQLPSAQIGRILPQIQLPQLEQPNQLFNFQSLKGKVTLLNVFASWCEACEEEQVFLMNLAREGVLIYGLNYKDDKKDAKAWLNHWGNPYQIVAQDLEGSAAIDLGVYGAPETFVVDKQGIIRYRHVGILSQEDWEKRLGPLMKELEKTS